MLISIASDFNTKTISNMLCGYPMMMPWKPECQTLSRFKGQQSPWPWPHWVANGGMNYLFKDRQTSPELESLLTVLGLGRNSWSLDMPFGGIPATLLEMGKKLFSCEINGILVALLLKKYGTRLIYETEDSSDEKDSTLIVSDERQ